MRSTRSEGSAAARRGFILPAALLALTILTVITTAGFFSVQQEAKIGHASEHATQAFYLAEIGLSEVLGNWDNAAASSMAQWSTRQLSDTTALGVWTVTVTKGNDHIYYLDSRGTITTGGALLAGASRRVGVAARMVVPDFNPRAAVTTTFNASVNGQAEVHGEDHVPPGWGGVCSGALANKTGVLMQDTTAFGSTSPAVVSGNPPLVEDPSIGASTLNQFGDLDWSELTALASKVYSGGTLGPFGPQVGGGGMCAVGHSQNWGDPENPTAACGMHFPVIYIAGDAQLGPGTRGQGILLVEGDLSVQGDFIFNGMIIAQGKYEAAGSGNHVNGAVMAANLDVDQQSGLGSSVIDYSSCAVERAVMSSADLNRARPLSERAWVDVSALVGN